MLKYAKLWKSNIQHTGGVWCVLTMDQNCQVCHYSQAVKQVMGYPMGREGVYATGGPAFLAHTKQKVSNIVDLTVLRLAFFMGYGLNKVVQ